MFLTTRRNLFALIALSVALLPAAASAASVELMSMRVVKAQEADGDEIKLAISVDGAPDIIANKTVSQGQPWFLNRTLNYTKSVRVVMMEMDGAAGQLVGSNVLTTKAGIYESAFNLGGAHYVLTYKVTPTPAPPVAASYVLEIDWIFASKTQESGGDEIIFKYHADGGKTTTMTRTMKNKDVWKVNKQITFRTKATISLYDEDLAFDDHLGSKTFTAADVNIAWTPANFRGSDGTHYAVLYRVLRK